MVSPTASGKTVMGRAAAAKRRQPLWVVHRRELVTQAPPEVEAVTIQALVASGRRPGCDLLIWDECHHIRAEEWGQVAEDYRHVPILGLTATPERADGRALGDVFQSMVVAVQYSELLERELIVPCRVVRPDRVLDGLAQQPVKIYQEYAPGTQCFAFAASVKDAEELAVEFVTAGVSAACISAKTPKDQRDASMQAFRESRLQVLTNCNILTEGVNVPAAQTVLLAKNVSHVGAYMQIAGRVLRADEGKTHAILIDCFGVSHKRGFGFPTDDRAYSLDGVAMQSADKELKTCPQCRTVVHRSELTCSHCGFGFPKPAPTEREKALRIYNVELRMCYKGDDTPEPAKRREWERISQFARTRDWSLSWAMKEWRKLFPKSGYPPTTEDEQIEELARLLAHQAARGFKPGWVGFRYKDTFGEWPSSYLKARAAALSRQMGETQRAELRCSDCGASARLQWQGSERRNRTIRRTCKECGLVDFAKVNPQTTAAANLHPPWSQDDLPF